MSLVEERTGTPFGSAALVAIQVVIAHGAANAGIAVITNVVAREDGDSGPTAGARIKRGAVARVVGWTPFMIPDLPRRPWASSEGAKMGIACAWVDFYLPQCR